LVASEFINATILPTSQILLTQGVSATGPLFRPELYDPGRGPLVAGSSTLMAPSNPASTPPTTSTFRGYHHLSMLLSDGRVLILGGVAPPTQGNIVGAPFLFSDGRFTGEIFEPPYLAASARRVYIQSTETNISFNLVGATSVTFSVIIGDYSTDRPVKRVVLTRPGAVTHGHDTDQRYIELPFVVASTDGETQTLTVTSPGENLAPPGYYMLWVVVDDTNGSGMLLPSTAEFIKFY
jgi:hypothetical protein